MIPVNEVRETDVDSVITNTDQHMNVADASAGAAEMYRRDQRTKMTFEEFMEQSAKLIEENSRG